MTHGLKPYPAYKDSGVPWLDKIPAHWDLFRAKLLFRETDERSSTGEEELLSVSHITGVTLRSQKNITMFKAESYVGHKICHANDLVINTMWAWMGALGVARETGLVSPSYAVYRPSDSQEVCSEYLDHLLRTKHYVNEYVRRSTGIRSSRLRMYPEKFLDIPIILPSRHEQESIVAYLRRQNHLMGRYIRAQRKLIALLEEQKQSIIHHAVTRGLDPNVRLKPSGVEWLGEIPEHWNVGKLKYEMTFSGGGTPSKANETYWNGKIPWASPKDMKAEVLGDKEDHITEQALVESSSRLVPAGSILMVVRSGILQRTIPIALCARDMALNQDMKALRAIGRVVPEYFVFLVRGCEDVLLTEWRKQGATVESIEHTYLANTKIPIPEREEQDVIVRFLKAETAHLGPAIDATHREIDLIREYRTRLIADVVTGKLDVRQAAANLPEEWDLDEAEEEGDEDLDEAEVEADDGE